MGESYQELDLPSGRTLGYYEIMEPVPGDSGHVQLRPAQVLDRLAVLHDRLAHPAAGMGSYVHGYARSLAERGHLGQSLESEFSTGDYIMFYPYAPSMGAGSAREWCTDVARGMFTAEAFQVTKEMMQVAREISYHTGRGTEYIEEPVLPSPNGFAWFDSPLVFQDGHDLRVSTRAVSWQVIPIKWIPPEQATRRHPETTDGMGVRVLLWTLSGDPTSYESPESMVLRIGDLQFDHIMVIPFGERFPASMRKAVDTGKRFPASMRKAVDAEDKEVQSALHYVHVIWQLMNSEVAARQRHLPDRTTAKRVRRSIRQGEVTVITLRRAHSARDDELGHGEVDWSCRWLVQGHWRHLERYDEPHHRAIVDRSVRGETRCYICAGRIAWVAAYIKGPDDLPIKSSKHLFRLSR